MMCAYVLMGDLHNITSISDDGFYMRLRSLKNALEDFNKDFFQSSRLTITFFFCGGDYKLHILVLLMYILY